MIQPPYVTRQDRLRFFKVYNKIYGRFRVAEQTALVKEVHGRTLQRLSKKMDRSVRATEGRI